MIPVERDSYSAPFFDAATEGTLLLRYSPSSGEWSEPAAQVCSVTQATDLEWRAAAGTGSLVTWTIKPGRESTTVAGIVELAEGPWLAMSLDVPRAGLREGAPIRVTFVRSEDSEPLPVGILEPS